MGKPKERQKDKILRNLYRATKARFPFPGKIRKMNKPSLFLKTRERLTDSRYICIRMQAKHLRRVYWRKSLDGFKELLQPTTLGDLVASVETEVVAKHMLSKPHLQTPTILISVFVLLPAWGNRFLAILRMSLELGWKINYCFLIDYWKTKNHEERKMFPVQSFNGSGLLENA